MGHRYAKKAEIAKLKHISFMLCVGTVLKCITPIK